MKHNITSATNETGNTLTRQTVFFLYIFFYSFTTCLAQQKVGTITDKFKNYTEEYILKQQTQVFTPVLTPSGFVTDPHVITAAKLLYDNTGQENNSNAKVITDQQKKLDTVAMGDNTAPTQTEIKVIQQNQLNGKTPALTKTELQTKEINALLDDARKSKSTTSKNWTAKEIAEKTKPFSDALQTLKDQLSGKTSLSLKKAYYEMESAYGNPYSSYKNYEKAITESAAFIKSWLKQKGLSTTDNEALHYGIQQFMKDTLSISYKNIDLNKTTTTKHLPFTYDYEDFKGETDFRNYFTTKCLATGTGQCNSLPGAYLLFAEALDAPAYLSLAPLHSFVKYPDNEGLLNGYEPTSNYSINDKWYIEHLFITNKAINNKIYLDTLNKKMIVADCIFELAQGYIEKYGIADTSFLYDCINIAKQYYPRQNCLNANFLQSMILARQLQQSMNENGITEISKIDSIPAAKTIYTALQKNETTIKTLGFQKFPESLYEELMQKQDFKATVQKEKNISTKEKKNLFIKTTINN